MAKMTRAIFHDLSLLTIKAREISEAARIVSSNLCRPKSFRHDLQQDQTTLRQMLSSAQEMVAKLELLSQTELASYDDLED